MDSIIDRVGTAYPWTHFEISIAFLASRCGTISTLQEHLLPYVLRTSVSEIQLDTSTWITFWKSMDFENDAADIAMDPTDGIMHKNYTAICSKIGPKRAPWFYLAKFAEDPSGLLAEIYPDIPEEIRSGIVKSSLVQDCPQDTAHVLINIAAPSDFGQTRVLNLTPDTEPPPHADPLLLPAHPPMVISRKTFFECCKCPGHTSRRNKMLMLFTSRQKECASIWAWRFPSYEYHYTPPNFSLPETDFRDFVDCKMVAHDSPSIPIFKDTLKSMVAEEDLVDMSPDTIAAMMFASFEPNRVDAWRTLGFAIDATVARKATIFTQQNPNARFDLMQHLSTL